MNISIDRAHFLDRVDLLKNITKVKSLIPVTRNVLIDLTAGGSGRVIATNLEITAITNLKTSHEGEPVKICVKGATLQEVLCNLKEQNVELTYPDSFPSNAPVSGSAVITQGRIEVGIAIADPDEFPDVPLINEVETIKLAAKDIITGVNKVFYAVSRDESRYVLTGMLMQVKDGHLVVAGTDGFRMSVWKKDLKDEPDTPQIVIPAATVKIIRDALDENASVGIIITEDKIQLMTESVTIIVRTINLAFPEYENVIGGTSFEHVCFMRRTDLIDCLNRMAAVCASNDSVILHRVPEGLLVETKSDLGYCRELVDARFKDDSTAMDYSFNLKFPLDALEHLDGDELTIRYPKSYGAVCFDESNYICVVMPIRDDASPIEQAAYKNLSQGSVSDTHEAHNLNQEGSTPSPATSNTEGSGEKEEGSEKPKKQYRVKK